MNQSAKKKLYLLVLIIASHSCILCEPSFAAFPIHQQSEMVNTISTNQIKLNNQNNIVSIKREIPDVEKKQKTSRSGIFGVLSIFFAFLPFLIPAMVIVGPVMAIIFGIIGVQKGRKPNFLAVLGLILGILSLLFLLIGTAILL